mmetsp:Transcript_4127/g.12887  ORF Transcript_4127/g.12887 Transcript_4127/m.12887 type:complete len:224 (+) Transcript_4127:1413-2084(+)
MVGTMLGRNSTTVTSDPSRLHTEPISRPMYPPPMTTMRSGTDWSSSAPVEDTMVCSSMGTPGSSATAEPVARRTFFACSVSEPEPSLSATSTDPEPAAPSLPQPLTYVTLFFLNRPSIPLVSPVTALAFCLIIAGTSMEMSPEILMPCFLKLVFASWYIWLECSSALEGMQPTLRHVPPSVPRPSTHAVFSPSCAALMAATYPPGPPPTTTTSYGSASAMRAT